MRNDNRQFNIEINGFTLIKKSASFNCGIKVTLMFQYTCIYMRMFGHPKTVKVKDSRLPLTY